MSSDMSSTGKPMPVIGLIAIVLGGLSLMPMLGLAAVGGVIVGIIALVKKQRMTGAIGILLSLVGLAMHFMLVAPAVDTGMPAPDGMVEVPAEGAVAPDSGGSPAFDGGSPDATAPVPADPLAVPEAAPSLDQPVTAPATGTIPDPGAATPAAPVQQQTE